MLVTSIAAVRPGVGHRAMAGTPEGVQAGQCDHPASVINLILMSSAFVLVVAVPTVGLWPLLLLVLSRPVEAIVARMRANRRPMPGARAPSS